MINNALHQIQNSHKTCRSVCIGKKKISNKIAVAFKKHIFYHMKTKRKNIPKRKIICKNVYHLFIYKQIHISEL